MSENLILNLINTIAADTEHSDEISVLPLMCGTGKSTAISYKIKETIENVISTGNGLLIVTDRKDRMYDYLEPHDSELREYIQNHENQITIMNHDTLELAHKTKFYRPVLIMTTQRFFRLSDGEREECIQWKNGTRPLIIIDERPELATIVELNERNISNSIISINEHFATEPFTTYSSEFSSIQETYKCFMYSLSNTSCYEKDHIYCFWSWYNEDCERDSIDNYDSQFLKISKERESINSIAGGTYYEDVYTKLRALRQLRERLALLYNRRTKQRISSSFFVYLNNYDMLKRLRCKCIILDGTATLSPEYEINSFHMVNTKEFSRDLSKLNIRIVNVPTDKTSMSQNKDYRDRVVDFVRLYYEENIKPDIADNRRRFALFTYKDMETQYKKDYGNECVEHFGNIIGKNDFREAKHIIQIGLNRFPGAVYYMYFLEMHPSEYERYENANDAYYYIDYQNQILKTDLDEKIIETQSKAIDEQLSNYDSECQSIMNHILLAEIEQNMFRGIIRNSDISEDYYYHLFINTTNYSALIEEIIKRYRPLGANIMIEDSSTSKRISIEKIVRRKRADYAQAIIYWHDKLEVNGEYTPVDIRHAIGLSHTASGIKSYEQILHNNPVLKILMNEERVKRGRYRKKNNWHIHR